MNTFYRLTTAVKNYLLSHNNINTVRIGNLSDIDLDKQNIYPLAQIIVEETSFEESVTKFNMKVLAMDAVRETNTAQEDVADLFLGIDNKQDVYNSMLAVVNGLQTNLKRGLLWKSDFQLDGSPTATPFEDAYGNLLTGWMLDFTLIIPNTIVGSCEYDLEIITFDTNMITWDQTHR